jgi:5-methylthioadenosine/S-adenosylhomocysteine deaminase
MGPQNVDTVVIAGEVMKRNGAMLGISYDCLTRLGDEARDRVYAAVGVKNTRV